MLAALGIVMAQIIEREDLRKILHKWQAAQLTSKQVHEWANNRFATDAWDAEDEITNEILSRLDMLDMNLLVPEDVPTLLQALSFENGLLADALQFLESYEANIDIRERKQRYANNPLYAPFCKQA